MCGGSKIITTITVTSVAFNLNGPPSGRRRYAPTQIFAAINRNSQTIAGDFVQSLLKGPNIKYRSLLNRAKRINYYDAVGQNRWSLGREFPADKQNTLEFRLTGSADSMVILGHASIGTDDWSMTISRGLYSGGSTYATDWVGKDNNIISDLFQYYANAFPLMYYTLGNPTWTQRIFTLYYRPSYSLIGSMIYEPVITDFTEWPTEIQDMHLISNTTTYPSGNRNQTTTVVITYGDNRPPITTSNTVLLGSVSWQNFSRIYKRTGYFFDYESDTDGRRYDAMQLYYRLSHTASIQPVVTQTVVDDVVDGVLVRTTTTITTDTLIATTREYQRYKQKAHITNYGPIKLWEYQLGWGNVEYDGWINNYPMEPFFPVIPLRQNNQRISEIRPDIASINNRLLKRAYNISYQYLEDRLQEHESINDIDHAYLFYGVPLNAKDNASKLYLFKFFDYFFKDATNRLPHSNEGWQYSWNRSWAWDAPPATNWLGNRSPIPNHYPSMLGRWFTITNGFNLNLRYFFYFTGCPSGSGQGWPGAKSGQVRISLEGYHAYKRWGYPEMNGYPSLNNWRSAFSTEIISNIEQYEMYVDFDRYEQLGELTALSMPWLIDTSRNNYNSERIKNIHSPTEVSMNYYNQIDVPALPEYVLTYQEAPNKWRQIRISSLCMENHIYNPKYETWTVAEASVGIEEDCSFIIPLHPSVLKSMNFMDATEVCTQGGFLLCNCYVIKETKVKKKGFFGFLIGIIVAVVAIAIAVFAPALAPNMTFMFTSIGTAMGLTGVAAVVAGAAVSMIAGVIITQLITQIAVAIFGKKLGAILGQIIAVVAMAAIGGGFSADGAMSGIKGLMSAEGVIKMTVAVGSGVQQYSAVSAQEKAVKLTNFLEEANKQLKTLWQRSQDLANKYNEEFGPNHFMFNSWSDPYESPSSFFSRTLMCGSDVAAITLSFINNYCETTLALKPALT